MAIFQTNEPHADEHPRRALTRDDAAFLARLQTILNTQSSMGNAQPVFWVIKGSVETYVDVDAFDATHVVIKDQLHDVSSPDKIRDLLASDEMRELAEDQGFEYSAEPVTDGTLVTLATVTNEVERKISDVEDVADLLVFDMNVSTSDVRTIEIEPEPTIYPDTLFLTHAACQEHLKNYGHNYDASAHAFAMTATRSPEFERLLDVIRSVRWDAVPTADADEDENVRIHLTCPRCGGANWFRRADDFGCVACGEVCDVDEMCASATETEHDARSGATKKS